MVGLLESMMTASVVDDLTDTPSSKNRECTGLGLANAAAEPVRRHRRLRDDRPDGEQREIWRARPAVHAVCGAFLLILMVLLKPWVSEVPVAALVAIMVMVSIDTFDWSSLGRWWSIRGCRAPSCWRPSSSPSSLPTLRSGDGRRAAQRRVLHLQGRAPVARRAWRPTQPPGGASIACPARCSSPLPTLHRSFRRSGRDRHDGADRRAPRRISGTLPPLPRSTRSSSGSGRRHRGGGAGLNQASATLIESLDGKVVLKGV